MNERDAERLDRITATLHSLLNGSPGPRIPCDDDPDDEIRQVSTKVNQLLRDYTELREWMVPLSQGQLGATLPRRNLLAAPFKQLHASLSHLTWQTRQIAQGDYCQRVDYLGDFSEAFNTMAESLQEARKQLLNEIERHKELAAVRSRYLHVMAHDIRTPLGSILGLADILAEDGLPDSASQHVDQIRRNARSLLSLINNILDMAKLEKRKMILRSEEFSLATLIEDVAAMVRPQLHPGVELVVEIDRSIGRLVRGDPHRLQQVLLNLASNGVKFTESGSVRVAAICVGERTRFVVEDTGSGIAENELDGVFEAFVQAGGGSLKAGGTGLGLAIARELVELMGGKLEVRSELGQGTAFQFDIELPVRPSATSGQPVEPVAEGHRVMMVGMSPDQTMALTEAVRNMGIDCEFDHHPHGVDLGPELIRADEKERPYSAVWINGDEVDAEWGRRLTDWRKLPTLNNPRWIVFSTQPEAAPSSVPQGTYDLLVSLPVSGFIIAQLRSAIGLAESAISVDEQLRGVRIMVVDDNAINRLVLCKMLSSIGVDAQEFSDARTSIAALADGGFDLVIMDQNMPGLSGAEAIRLIREDSNSRQLPILAFSADDSDENRRELSAVGADGFLDKPVERDQLIDELVRLLPRR